VVRSRRGSVQIGSSILIALIAATFSFGRVLVASPGNLGELVWAEDGLFALCVRKAGGLECFVDPFAGYLLGLPRLLAMVTATFPLESWGWATNAIAAVAWGLLSGVSAYWLLGSGIRLIPAAVIALLPVVVPLVGLEAVNVIGSVYMPLLFTTTLALALGWQGRAETATAAVLAFASAITIPTAGLLILVLAVSTWRGWVARQQALIVAASWTIGMTVQLWVVLNAPDGRNVALIGQSIGFWLTDLPVALLTIWPGLFFGSTTIFGIFTLPVVSWTGFAVAAGLLVLGVVWARSKQRAICAAGLMIATGLAYSFVPTATGYASNRYFVLSVVGVLAGVILWLDGRFAERRAWSDVAVVGVFAVAWSAAFAASPWRATAAPAWSSVLEQVDAQCANDPTAPARFTFSPEWPQEGVTELRAPTNQFAPCSALNRDFAR